MNYELPPVTPNLPLPPVPVPVPVPVSLMALVVFLSLPLCSCASWLSVPRIGGSSLVRARSTVAALYDGGSGTESGYLRDNNDGGGEIDAKRVDRLLADRNNLRRMRRYQEADAIRDELMAMGVRVWDRDRLWSCSERPPSQAGLRSHERTRNNFYRNSQRRGSEPGRDSPFPPRPIQRREPRTFNEWGHDYGRAEDCEATTINGTTLLAINNLLRQRLEAKFAKDFSQADALLQELEFKYSVTVNDGSKLWRADGKSFVRKYLRQGPRIEGVDEASVEQLICERMAARKARDYRRADSILAELLEEHGVVVIDRDWRWRYVGTTHDGEYGEGGSYGRRAGIDASSHDYQREMGDDAPIEPGQLERVHELLAQRLAKKKQRQFDEADALQEQLLDLGIGVDDRARVWYLVE